MRPASVWTKRAQTCKGHPPGPHTASLHQPCTSHQTLKTSVFSIPSYKLGWKRLMNLHQDFTVKHRTPLRVLALFDFLFWVASILSSCQLCSLLLVSWLTPTFSLVLKLCLCFLFASLSEVRCFNLLLGLLQPTYACCICFSLCIKYHLGYLCLSKESLKYSIFQVCLRKTVRYL